MTTEQLETSLTRVQDWIKAADQKASIFLALVLGSLALGGIDFMQYLSQALRPEQLWLIIVFVADGVILVWSIFKVLFIIKPSVANNAKSFTYFGHIAQLSLKKYTRLISDVDGKKYRSELIEQIHTSSKIARKKHKQLAEAMQLFCICIVILALAIGLTYVT